MDTKMVSANADMPQSTYISLSGIRYTISKDRERLHGVTKPRSGRPKKLNEADRDRLLNAIHGDPKVTQEDLLSEVSYKVYCSYLINN